MSYEKQWTSATAFLRPKGNGLLDLRCFNDLWSSIGNPKFTAQANVPLRPQEGRLRCAARQNGLAAQANVPLECAERWPSCSANFGLHFFSYLAEKKKSISGAMTDKEKQWTKPLLFCCPSPISSKDSGGIRNRGDVSRWTSRVRFHRYRSTHIRSRACRERPGSP